ncbi:uncharacterized protein [Ptychodera flava]|uniref:uncharacterized protein n=1 Tax=Ptychodera flava TaxID=63121 RepID=UPI00396A7534
MAYQSEVNAVLVTGVPRSIASSVARLKLTIHFQRGAVSGGADVDEVRESDREDSAYEVYFTGEQASDAVKTVLNKRSQNIYFGDEGHCTCDVRELSRPRSHYKMTPNEGERKNVDSTGHTPAGSFQDALRKTKERAPIADVHSISLSDAEMRQLKMSNFADKVKQSFPHLVVSYGQYTPAVDLKGTQEDVKDVTVLTYKHLRNLPVARKARPLSQTITDFLQSPKGESAVGEYFRVRQIQACYFVDDGDFKCSGINAETIDRAKRFIEEEITERRLECKDKAVPVVKSRKCSEIIRRLEKDYECLSVDVTRHGDVVLVGKNSSVISAKDEIQRYISANVETEWFEPMESGRLRFLCDREEFLKFKQTTRQLVTIQVQRYGEKKGVKLLGVKDDVDNALPQLKTMVQKIAKRRHNVDSPGMQQIIKDHDTSGYLRLIEVDCKCAIDVAEESTYHSSDESYKKLPTSPKGTEPRFETMLEHTRQQDGRRIVVVCGDITKLKVDAIATTAKRDFGTLEGLYSKITDAGKLLFAFVFFAEIFSRSKHLIASCVSLSVFLTPFKHFPLCLSSAKYMSFEFKQYELL